MADEVALPGGGGVTVLLEVGAIDEPVEAFLARHATVVRTFGERKDSRSLVVGVEVEGRERYVVKACADADKAADLANAAEVHRRLRHPAIVPVLHSFSLAGGGLALVMPWASGEVLVDGYDPNIPGRDEPGSPYQRFVGMPVNRIVDALRQIVDAHVAVVDAGLVAVDLYENCIVYDFERGAVALVDLDHYSSPYVLAFDRQLGSASFMAPEEFVRGAAIDQRTTVYTLGRLALVFLGCARKGQAERRDFRGPDALWELLGDAVRPRPEDRITTVRDLANRWDRVWASR